MNVEVSPAVLRNTYEGIAEDWDKVKDVASHIQIDVTDGVFAGDGSFREIRRFKQLPKSEKIELHMMVHTPSNFVDDIVDLSPARCIFHLESFEGTHDIENVYGTLREKTQTEVALAINPDSPSERLDDYLSLIHFVLFMGYNPGWANQPVDPVVFRKIGQFHDKNPDIPISVDGHVGKDTIEPYVKAGASMLASNTAIFGKGDPVENLKQLQLLAESVFDEKS